MLSVIFGFMVTVFLALLSNIGFTMVGTGFAPWPLPQNENAPYSDNLLQNANAETGDMSGWAIPAGHERGWLVTNGKGFSTSYFQTGREQVVDLSSKGFSGALMDMQPPIVVTEMFSKNYCPDFYFLEIELLDINKKILSTWKSGERKHQTDRCDYIEHAERIEHRLTHYGKGVRFVRWRDGGRDSEYWLGHFGTRLHDAYLGILPINLLKEPDKLSSWTVIKNGGDGFWVTGSGASSEFHTSYDWGVRSQLIDLLESGYSLDQLSRGYPILISGRYGKVGCPDEYYLKGELLDAKKNVITSWQADKRTHDGGCNPSASERLSHLFKDYGPNVRYVRWEDGGKDTEWWRGHYGAVLQRPYVGLFSMPQQLSISPMPRARRLSAWPVVGGGIMIGGSLLLGGLCLTPAAPLACPTEMALAGSVAGGVVAGASVIASNGPTDF